MKKNPLMKGFTLIELLVAATIIIVLTTIGVVSYTNAGVTARNSKRAADMETVRQALVLYRSDNGTYPLGDYATAVGILISNGYLSAPAPADPKDPTMTYSYVPSGGTSFCLYASAEGTNKGNCTSNSCSFGTGDYFCAVNP